jgi:hypothetical protein
MRDQSAMAANDRAMIVMIMSVDADTHADATDMNADDGSIRRTCTHQGERKNRGNEVFHDGSLEGASFASFAEFGIDGSLAAIESRMPFIGSVPYTMTQPASSFKASPEGRFIHARKSSDTYGVAVPRWPIRSSSADNVRRAANSFRAGRRRPCIAVQAESSDRNCVAIGSGRLTDPIVEFGDLVTAGDARGCGQYYSFAVTFGTFHESGRGIEILWRSRMGWGLMAKGRTLRRAHQRSSPATHIWGL